jgi:crotonobetainyl-CoA:carnitine CoA-transferase CaiB-like acyl-CoA transferase
MPICEGTRVDDVGDGETATRPLSGVRILAVEQMIAMPWATQLLARLGADVVKVERPGTGESGRAASPSVQDCAGRRVGSTFIRNNLGKRSIAIDLARGSDIVRALAARSDVFVENFKAGALDRYSLGYEDLVAANPKIIYASVTGFGTTTDSPYREWPAYASVAEAMSGIYTWVQEPGRRPIVNPMGGLGDIGSGMFAAIGILAALRQRDLTGEPQRIDVAMFDAMVAIADVVPALASLGVRERFPEAIVTTFTAQDGDFVVQISREHQFERLAEFVGHEDWLTDPRLSTRQGWVDHLETVIRPAVEQWASTLSKLEASRLLAMAGIASGPCNAADEVLADPHLAERGMLLELSAADGQQYVVPGNPVRMPTAPSIEHRASPTLGENTDEVLQELVGLDLDEIARLRSAGVIE